MADESDATGSDYAPNYTPDDSDVNLDISVLGADLETGKPLGPRDQFALIRNVSSVCAMGSGARRRGQFKKAIKKVTFRHDEDEPSPKRRSMKWRNTTDIDMNTSLRGRFDVSRRFHDEETGKGKGTQYTLTAHSVRRVV
jgi:hypothetical protein